MAGDRWHSLPEPCDRLVDGISKRNHRVRFAGHGAVRPVGSIQNDIWIERFWGVLQAELLDREVFPTPEAADEGLTRFALYYDYHRLHGAIGWHTPAERWDGTPFTDRGFEYIPALEHLQGWLADLMAA